MQDFIKKVAERYGIKYDKKQEFPKVKLKDGTVKCITVKNFTKVDSKKDFE